MSACAIVNPRSGGRRTAKRWPRVEAALREAIPELEVVFTEGPEDATRLAREALAAGTTLVIAVGGDGTVNEVVNGFFDEHGQPLAPRAELGVLMMGTGGDFRRSFGIGKSWESCLERIVSGASRTIDLGRVSLRGDDGRPVTRIFDNIASFGASGAVVRAVNSARWSKVLGGAFSFRWNTFMALMRYRRPRVRIRIDDDFDEEIDLTLCAACNGQYFGGGMHAAPHAELDDGLFDVLLIEGMGTFDFIRNSSKLTKGTHLDVPGIRVVRGRRVVAEPVDDDARVLADVDGEAPGRLPLTFEIIPAALRVRA